MSIWQDLTLPPSLDDYLQARDSIRANIQAGYDALNAAEQEMRQHHRVGICTRSRPANTREQALADVDRQFWRLAFDLTGFGQYMDAQARREFEASLDKAQPPLFTRDNLVATFGDLIQHRDAMFQRGVVDLFRTLSRQYRTHDPFKIGPKLILTNYLQARFTGGQEIRFGLDADRINDLDRVLRTLDGETHQPRALESAMNTAFRDHKDYEDDRLKARPFRNGNIHLWLKRQSDIDRINRIIAEYLGGGLAHDRKTG